MSDTSTEWPGADDPEEKGFESRDPDFTGHSQAESWFGTAAPVELAPRPAAPEGRPRRQRRRMGEMEGRRRQPEPEEGAPLVGVDDGLPMPHLQQQPQPPPRQLTPERFHLIKEFHGGILPHAGVVNLVRALREAGNAWPTMDEDCRAFVARCHYCQLERLRRRGAEALPYRSVEIPSCLCEVWHFDILGPLPPCALSGSRYMLAGVEYTSKLVMVGHAIEQSTVGGG